jgi:2-desacetyl-2-hydroxyethyl bacteriochlorophyllide A dehydrogenase
MRARVLYFVAPRRVELREETVPDPAKGQIVVETELSAISAGTELLLYRGEIPAETGLDENLPSLAGTARYPAAYGYSAVGRDSRGRRVFAFQTHRSAFVAPPEQLFLLPESLPSESAALLPTIETAVSLVHDARPLYGERVLVVGQGVVGLALTFLLARFPLARLVSVDRWERRRRASLALGAVESFRPETLDERDFDLTFEVSGSPEALDLALAAAGDEGRIVVGSWYGGKRASVDLGTHFHRGRLRIVSSQVSRIAPDLRGRIGKERRFQMALEAASALPFAELVSHRFPIERAPEAYRLLDERPEECLQLLFTYEGERGGQRAPGA